MKRDNRFKNFLKERDITNECNIWVKDLKECWKQSRKHAAIDACEILESQIGSGTTSPYCDSIQAIKEKFGLEI